MFPQNCFKVNVKKNQNKENNSNTINNTSLLIHNRNLKINKENPKKI